MEKQFKSHFLSSSSSASTTIASTTKPQPSITSLTSLTTTATSTTATSNTEIYHISQTIPYYEDMEEYIDPITLCPIETQPVIAEDGKIYSIDVINDWFATCIKKNIPIRSPLLGTPMGTTLRDINKNVIQQSKQLKVINSNFFSTLDGILENIKTIFNNIPRCSIIILGQESCGKSTVLQRLINFMLFPHGKRRCTRCPIRIQLRRGNQQLPLMWIETSTGEAISISSLLSSELLLSIPAIHTLNNAEREVVSVNNIVPVVNALMIAISNLVKKQVTDEYEIFVRLQNPNFSPVDVVDLPGFVAVDNADPTMPTMTKQIAENYIQKYQHVSQFLIVCDSRIGINQSTACQLVQKYNLHDRSIGILTKLDLLEDEEEEKRISEIISCYGVDDFELQNGWFGIVSKVNSAINAFEIACSTENGFNEKWFRKYDIETTQYGIDNLRNAVNNMFEKFVFITYIPIISNSLTTIGMELDTQDRKLGLPIPDENDVKFTQQLIKDAQQQLSEIKNQTNWDVPCGAFLKHLSKYFIQLENIQINNSSYTTKLQYIRAIYSFVQEFPDFIEQERNVFDELIITHLKNQIQQEKSALKIYRFDNFIYFNLNHIRNDVHSCYDEFVNCIKSEVAKIPLVDMFKLSPSGEYDEDMKIEVSNLKKILQHTIVACGMVTCSLIGQRVVNFVYTYEGNMIECEHAERQNILLTRQKVENAMKGVTELSQKYNDSSLLPEQWKSAHLKSFDQLEKEEEEAEKEEEEAEKEEDMNSVLLILSPEEEKEEKEEGKKEKVKVEAVAKVPEKAKIPERRLTKAVPPTASLTKAVAKEPPKVEEKQVAQAVEKEPPKVEDMLKILKAEEGENTKVEDVKEVTTDVKEDVTIKVEEEVKAQEKGGEY